MRSFRVYVYIRLHFNSCGAQRSVRRAGAGQSPAWPSRVTSASIANLYAESILCALHHSSRSRMSIASAPGEQCTTLAARRNPA